MPIGFASYDCTSVVLGVMSISVVDWMCDGWDLSDYGRSMVREMLHESCLIGS